MAELTPHQRSYIRKKTTVHELDPSEMVGELNIVPFLDIVVNLIMFLLMTTASVIAISQIEAKLPGGSVGGRGGNPAEQTLNLSVTLTAGGVIVSTSGGTAAQGCRDIRRSTRESPVTLPRVTPGPVDTGPEARRCGRPGNASCGGYDFPALTDCVQYIKGLNPAFADERQVILTADPTVEYGELVGAMDAVRAKGTEELFPDVLLSAGVR